MATTLVRDCMACQRFARKCATCNLTPPHDPTLGSASHLRGCVGTGGVAERCEPPAHRWHARGQGSNPLSSTHTSAQVNRPVAATLTRSPPPLFPPLGHTWGMAA